MYYCCSSVYFLDDYKMCTFFQNVELIIWYFYEYICTISIYVHHINYGLWWVLTESVVEDDCFVKGTGPVRKYRRPSSSTIGPLKECRSPSSSTTGPVREYHSPSSSNTGPVREYRSPSSSNTGPVREYCSPSSIHFLYRLFYRIFADTAV